MSAVLWHPHTEIPPDGVSALIAVPDADFDDGGPPVYVLPELYSFRPMEGYWVSEVSRLDLYRPLFWWADEVDLIKGIALPGSAT